MFAARARGRRLGAAERFGAAAGEVGTGVVFGRLDGLRVIFALDGETLGPPVKVHADLALNLPQAERLIQNQPEQEDRKQNSDDGGFRKRTRDGKTSSDATGSKESIETWRFVNPKTCGAVSSEW